MSIRRTRKRKKNQKRSQRPSAHTQVRASIGANKLVSSSLKRLRTEEAK